MSLIFFPSSLLGEKFLSGILFPLSVPQEYKPTSITTTMKSKLSWEALSAAGLWTVMPSHVHFSSCIIWVSQVKKDYQHVNSIWWPKTWQKNFSFSVSWKYLSSSSGWNWSHLTLNPSWAALIAATYPPGPEPITVTSASTETENISIICVSAIQILMQEWILIYNL